MVESWEYRDVTVTSANSWITVWKGDKIVAFEKDTKKAIQAFIEAVQCAS